MNWLIRFRGELLPNTDLIKAQFDFAELTNFPQQEIEKIFLGKEVVLKTNVSKGEAIAYQENCKKHGIIVHVYHADETPTDLVKTYSTSHDAKKNSIDYNALLDDFNILTEKEDSLLAAQNDMNRASNKPNPLPNFDELELLLLPAENDEAEKVEESVFQEINIGTQQSVQNTNSHIENIEPQNLSKPQVFSMSLNGQFNHLQYIRALVTTSLPILLISIFFAVSIPGSFGSTISILGLIASTFLTARFSALRLQDLNINGLYIAPFLIITLIVFGFDSNLSTLLGKLWVAIICLIILSLCLITENKK